MKSHSEQLTVGEICTREVVYAYPSMSIGEAARLMREAHVGSLVVVSDMEQKKGSGGHADRSRYRTCSRCT